MTDVLARPPAGHERRRGRSFRLRAPAAVVYLGVVAATTVVLHGLAHHDRITILRHLSTNLHNMTTAPWRVLLPSAFVVRGGIVGWLVPMVAVLVPAERWYGTRRVITVAAAGHVGASLATTAGIWWVTLGGKLDQRLVHTVDVGVSYAVYAVAASLVYRLPPRWRWVPIAGMGGAVARLVVAGGTYTDWGHVAALAIGLAMGALLGLADRARPAVAG